MALTWPPGSPMLDAPTVRALPALSPTPPARPDEEQPRPLLARARDLALQPVTTLVAMLLGLVLLFAYPLVGLPFVALVVLPGVIFQLSAERRLILRRRR